MLNPSTTVEIVIKKKITLAEYQKLRPELLSKGYQAQAYQVGFYEGDKNRKEIES